MQGYNKFNNLFQVLYGYFNNIWLIGVHIYVCTNIYTKCVKFQQKTLNCKVVGAHQSFPQLCKTFCLYSHHAYFILSYKSVKHVTESNNRLNPWSLFIKWGTQFFITADWIIENDSESLHCFLHLNILHKNSKITVTCPKLIKMNR